MKKTVLRGGVAPGHRKIGSAVMALLLAVAIGAGSAFAGGEGTSAADGWGIRTFMNWPDSEGVARINEDLADIIVPVGQIFESDALKVTVIDAAYDGRSAVLSWTVENTLDTPIYLICRPIFNGEGAGAGSGRNESELLINPGETVSCARSTSLIEQKRYDAETCEFVLRMTALTPTGPVVTLRYEENLDTDAVDALIAEGKVVIGEGGYLWLGSLMEQEKYQEMDYIDFIVDAGVMARADTLDASFAIAKAGEARIGVADRTEIDYGDFTMRLVEAVRTANTVTILLDAVFDSEDSAGRYEINPLAAMRAYGGPSILHFEDSAGNDYFGVEHLGNSSIGSIEREPVPQPDGTWTWRAMAASVDFLYVDDVCRIVTVAPVYPDKSEASEQVITIAFGADGEGAPPADAAANAREPAVDPDEQLQTLLIRTYEELAGTYADALTDEERLIIRHALSYAIGSENTSYISPDMDWRKLLSDLQACDSAEAFHAVLYGDYVYFNQSPPGEPTRDEILRAAEATIAALGYGDMKLRSFLYTGPVSGGGTEFHDVVIAGTVGKQERWPEQAVVASIGADGKVRHLESGSISLYQMEPFTGAARENVVDFVWDLAVHFIGLSYAPVEGSVRVAENACHQQDGDRLVKAYVLFDRSAEESSEPETTAVAMIINADKRRVMQISFYAAESVEEYFMNSLF